MRCHTWRAKLRFAPTDRWNIDLAYWKYDSGSAAGSNEAMDDMTNSSFLAVDNVWHSGSLTSTYDFDGSQLFYGFSDANLLYGQGGELAPGIPLDAIIDITVRTHELRWSSTGDRTLDWTVGYYLRDAIREDALDSLEFITDQEFKGYEDARAWWDKNRTTFKFDE